MRWPMQTEQFPYHQPEIATSSPVLNIFFIILVDSAVLKTIRLDYGMGAQVSCVNSNKTAISARHLSMI